MKSGVVGSFSGWLGRRLGGVLGSSVDGPAGDVIYSVLGLSEPVLRAFIDAFLADKFAATTVPSAVVLVAVVLVHGVCSVTFSPERDRIFVGFVVLLALVWSVCGLFRGLGAALPFAAIWFVTRLPPSRQARLLIFLWLRERLAELVERKASGEFLSDVVTASLAQVQKDNALTPDRIGFALAEHLSPLLVRHLVRRTIALVVPVVAAFLYYRMVIYPNIIERYTMIGPWGIAAYPLAALSDAVLGTHLRDNLQR